MAGAGDVNKYQSIHPDTLICCETDRHSAGFFFHLNYAANQLMKLRFVGLNLLLFALVILPGFHLSARELPGDFFPDGTFDDFDIKWFGKDLSIADEPSLFQISKKEPSAEVYRVTYLPPYTPYMVIRLRIQSDGSGLIHIKKMHQTEGLHFIEPRLARESTFVTPAKCVQHFQYLLRKIQFWHLPTDRSIKYLGGDMYLYEGVSGGRYHVIEIPEPEYPPLEAPGLYLMKLCGERIRS